MRHGRHRGHGRDRAELCWTDPEQALRGVYGKNSPVVAVGRGWPSSGSRIERSMRLLAQQAPQALLQLRQHDALLCLILSFAIGVTGLADLIRLEEDNLAQPFVGVDLCRKRRRIGNLERHE